MKTRFKVSRCCCVPDDVLLEYMYVLGAEIGFIDDDTQEEFLIPKVYCQAGPTQILAKGINDVERIWYGAAFHLRWVGSVPGSVTRAYMQLRAYTRWNDMQVVGGVLTGSPLVHTYRIIGWKQVWDYPEQIGCGPGSWPPDGREIFGALTNSYVDWSPPEGYLGGLTPDGSLTGWVTAVTPDITPIINELLAQQQLNADTTFTTLLIYPYMEYEETEFSIGNVAIGDYGVGGITQLVYSLPGN